MDFVVSWVLFVCTNLALLTGIVLTYLVWALGSP